MTDTDLQDRAMELSQQRAQLQERFISHVSHELRTPLTAIYFFTTNLLDGLLGELTPDQHAHLSLAIDNIEQLKEMINDLLDISRVDAKKIVLEPQYAAPARLVAGALSTCNAAAAAKRINLHSEVGLDLPYLWADPVRVQQILVNLIDNGIKFTPEGGTVTVRAEPMVERNDWLRLSVGDTGCGIGPEDCVRVFDRLAQVRNTGEACRRGLGLGLFLAKGLIALHGGTIWVESQLGTGSTFYFTLPLFSLAKLTRPLFTASNLERACVALLTVDILEAEGGASADLALEIRTLLESCIQVESDILIHPLSNAKTVLNFFVVSCTDAAGAAVTLDHIRTELQNLDYTARLKSVFDYTVLPIAPTGSMEERIVALSEQIERLIQAHLSDGRSTAGKLNGCALREPSEKGDGLQTVHNS